MKLKKALGKVFPIFDSDLRKKRIVNDILYTDQFNNDIINIHRYDKTNVGDYYCAPHLYFEELKGKYLDISDIRRIDKRTTKNWAQKVSENALIIGGGGLLNIKYFDLQMKLFQQLIEKGKKTVIWGAGHNEFDRSKFSKIDSYNINTDNFGLVGTRDYGMNTEWVPCVSCLNKIFDEKFEEFQEIGLIFHKKTVKNKHHLLNKLKNYPSTSNTTNLDDMVTFIGKTNILVTDSYHAMYWSILLGKKTLVIPTSSKFFDFKYNPVFTTYDNFEKDIHKAISYSGVLNECREININFADKVFNYINS